jgi:hypothetical protein
MARFIVMTAIALALTSGIANAAKNVTPTTPAAHSNRHACEPGHVFTCDGHRACKCS